jgi:hypothetical protein
MQGEEWWSSQREFECVVQHCNGQHGKSEAFTSACAIDDSPVIGFMRGEQG